MAIKTYDSKSATKLSTNFRINEFSCKCGKCSKVLIDDQLVVYLQKIRDHFGKPVHISAYRCETWNKAVGGVSRSYHLYGQAADTTVDGVAPAAVAKYAESIGIKGIGLYETKQDGFFVHIDTRTTKSFWYGQGQARRTTFGGAPAQSTTTTTTPATTSAKTCTVTLPILKYGINSEAVKTLQQLLNAKGHNCGTPDKIFGNKTKTAVIALQKKYKLPATGEVDAKTWAKLIGV